MAERIRSLTVRVEGDIADAMDRVQEKWGTPLSEQVRRALRAWLEGQGMLTKPRTSRKPDTK